MPPRVVQLTIGHRVPPGLLSRQAWAALEAHPVFTAEPAHPQVAALREAGIAVTVLAAEDLVALDMPAAVWLGSGLATETLTVDWFPPGAVLLDAVAVMDRLRSPGGCPWDAEQTHASLRPYVLEEAYEVAQAIDDGDPMLLAEELGDLLLQVLFHSRVASEDPQSFDIDAVAGILVDKLVRRHPHVFADESRRDAADVEAGWDAIKAVEKGGRSVTGGVAVALPSLALVNKLLGRASKVGLEPVDVLLGGDALAQALAGVVVTAREFGEDAEASLHALASGVLSHLQAAEQSLLDAGLNPSQAPVEAWRAALAST